MDVQYKIKYDPLNMQLHVLQDGIVPGTYSQFSRCNALPFWEWFDKLPDYCFHEANSNYKVSFEGGCIYSKILKLHMLSKRTCTGYSALRETVSMNDKIKLADELAKDYNRSLPELKVGISILSEFSNESLQDIGLLNYGKYYVFRNVKYLPIHIYLTSNYSQDSSIMIVSKNKDFDPLAASMPMANDVKAVIAQGGSGWEFIQSHNNYFLFQCGKAVLGGFLYAWMQDVLFPEYLDVIVHLFREYHGWGKDTAREKCLMLTRAEPYLRLDIPQRIEISNTLQFRFIKFPDDMPCTIRTSNPNVAVLAAGNTIKPVSEGRAVITARSKEYPAYFTEQAVEIYKYQKVKKINLSMQQADVVEGESFLVQYTVYPPNAQITSQARWEIAPQRSIKMISPESFLACSPGACTLTLWIDQVCESIYFNIIPKAVEVKFPQSSISVKLGDDSQQINAVILPAGSIGKIQYHVSDNRILSLNPVNGQIHPKSEGNSVITATLIDENNHIINDAYCNITILPLKNVYTPDGVLILLFISLIGFFLLSHTMFQHIFGLLVICGAAWFAIQNKKWWITMICIVLISTVIISMLL